MPTTPGGLRGLQCVRRGDLELHRIARQRLHRDRRLSWTTPSSSSPIRADLGGYNTLNLRAGLDNGRWSFELYCKNIADTRGLASYTSIGAPNFGGDDHARSSRARSAARSICTSDGEVRNGMRRGRRNTNSL